MARAKIESKKHFDALPNATDAEQQAWIEEKIRLDFGRLLDRLAAQLNSEIVGIPLYQIGYADHYFNKATNPRMAEVDDEALSAARMICSVLPALSESVVSHQHQNAAHALVHALAQGAPLQDSFIAAIFMLAQDPQVRLGLDKLLGNIFLPKTGSQLSQLARKRASNGSDQSGSGNGVNPSSSAPAGAPVWHWKEPATIANSSRYNLYPIRAPGNGGFNNTVVQPYYQDPLPPPILVQAEIYRPPPPLPPPPPGYHQQPYMPNQPQSYYQNSYYPRPPPNLAPPSNWMSQGYHEGRMHGNWSTPLSYNAHAESYPQPSDTHCQSYQRPSYQSPINGQAGKYQQPSYPPPHNAHAISYQTPSNSDPRPRQQPLDASDEGLPNDTDDRSYQRLLDDVEGLLFPDGESASPAVSSRNRSSPIDRVEASGARTPSAPPNAAPSLMTDRDLNECMPTRPSRSSRQTRNEPRAVAPNSHSAGPPEVVVISDPASDESIRKHSPSIQTRGKHVAKTDGFSATPEKPVVISDPAPDESLRRRSSRGTVLTSKAKAAGILLGTQVKDPGQTSSRRVSKPPGACHVSVSPEANGELPLTAGDSPSGIASTSELAESPATDSNSVASKDSQEVAAGFVPRSSGRERKPTAKILASSSLRSSLKFSDYSSSVPRVSSRLRLSLSSQSSENSTGSKDTSGDKMLTPSTKIQTSSKVAEGLVASQTNHGSSISKASTRSDSLGQHTTSELDRRQNSNNERRTCVDKRSTDLDNLRQRIFSDEIIFADEQDTSPDEHIMRPVVGRSKSSKSVLPVNVAPIKCQNFLTNGKGQGMGQALLMMAQVAAEWSDSDDEDDQMSKDEFQSKLQQAVDKQIQQSKFKMKSAALSQVPQEISSTLPQPGTGVLPTLPRTAPKDTAPSPNLSTGVHKNNVPPAYQRMPPPNPGPQDSAKHASTDPRSISQITDDFIALISLKDEANIHGLPINDCMSLDELTNLVDAYHAGNLDFGNNSGVRTPSGATMNGSPETRAAQANQRPRNGVSDEIFTAGSTNGSRNSTPSTRCASSATPQPRMQTPPKIPTFKKGGTVMNFRVKAKRAFGATST